MQRYTWFIILLGTSLVFFSISLFALPFVLIAPAKFASTWTMGSLLFISSFAFLNGYKAHLQALMSEDRRVFSGVYVCSMLMTLYFSIIVPSWFVIVCIIMQMVALGWYIATYLPGGVGAMASLSRSILPI